MGWDSWKKSFDHWEERTAKLLEVSLKSPFVLRPAARALSASLRAKAATDKLGAYVIAHLGLPTKADQERTLHAIYRLESRLIDLEEKLAEARAELAKSAELKALTPSGSGSENERRFGTAAIPAQDRPGSPPGRYVATRPLAELHVEKRK